MRTLKDFETKSFVTWFVLTKILRLSKSNLKIDDEEWAKYISWMEAKKLSWITWSVSDKDETCSVLLPTAADNGNWTDAQLKASGLKTKAHLLKYNKD